MNRLPLVALLLTPMVWGCRVSPLINRVAAGEVPFLVMVGEGPDGQTDLFAVDASGGEVVRFTFSRDAESHPALDPSGVMVAFIRDAADGTRWLAVMNLLSSAERETALPADLGTPARVGWNRDGTRLFVTGSGGRWSAPAPPARLQLDPVPDDGRAEADSSILVLLGDPAFASAFPCPDGAGICVSADGAISVIVPDGRDPFRWGADSLGYLRGGRLEVRPLGPGRSRALDLVRAPSNPRQPTYSAGVPGA